MRPACDDRPILTYTPGYLNKDKMYRIIKASKLYLFPEIEYWADIETPEV